GIQEHHGILQPNGQIGNVIAHEIVVFEQFGRLFAEIPLQPEAAAHALETTVSAAKTFRAAGMNRDVAELARPRIGAAIDSVFGNDTAPDASGERHIEKGPEAAARAVLTLAQRTGVRIVVHYRGHAY